jgi:hypothetical protein
MPTEHVKTCPDCAEEVKPAAAKCRFCNYRFDEVALRAEPSTEPERICRRTRWPWVAAASFLALAVGGGAYLATAHSSAAADETYANCKAQTAPVFTAIQDLNSHLHVGLNQGAYSNAVGDTKAVFDRLQADKIPRGCVKVVASLDRAMRWYTNASSEWNSCIQSDYCTPEPQPSWDAADGHVAAARRLLESLRPTGSITPSNADTPAEQDSEAQSTARNLVSQVETCATDYAGEYTNCDSSHLANTGLSLGAGKGEVRTTAVGSATYTVDALSKSGTHFTVTKAADGTSTRTCDRLDQGGCSLDGTW